MTWKLTPYAKTRRSLPGVNWRDLTDEEYEAALAANPGMDQRGYFEKVEDEPRRGTRGADSARVTVEPIDFDTEPQPAAPAEENTDD